MEHHNSSSDYSNSTWDYDYSSSDYFNFTWDWDYDYDWDYDFSHFEKYLSINTVMNYIIVSLGIPLCTVAVYVLYSLVRHDGKPAPVYVINLLISDIIQICCLVVNITPFYNIGKKVFFVIYFSCLLTSVSFMVCIALERYLLVVWPLWYRFRRPTRISVVASVLVWIFCLVVSAVCLFLDNVYIFVIFGILFLLPFPLFIFCLGGTLRALSSSSLPADEKRRIVAVLVLVLLIYTLLFLPFIIGELTRTKFILSDLPYTLLGLNPLADLVLYIFMQRRVADKLLASVCCCKLNDNDNSISTP